MKNFKKTWLPITTFARIDIRRLFRDKVGIFFVFVFPLIFLFVFGGLFGDDDNVSFNAALINESQTQFAADFMTQMKENEIIEVDEEVTTMDQAREKMNRGEISTTILLTPEFGAVKNDRYPSGEVVILYDQNEEQSGQALGSVMEAIFKDVNAEYVETETPFTVRTESTATKGLTRFDYIFAGLLGFSILGLGVFGPTTVFPRLKQRQVLRRYHTTTLKVWQYFTGNVISNAAVGLMSVSLMFIMAMLVFDLNMKGSYLTLGAMTILGVSVIFGIGLAIGGWAKNENQAAPLANIITFPMMFLSGVFFPTFLMPEWLQNISSFIPLTPIVDSMRLIITENYMLTDLGPQLLIISAWGVIIYTIAFRVFRWE